MSRPQLGIVRTEVNLFIKDKETMIEHYGTGWTTHIREIVENHCKMLRASGQRPRAMTVGDLNEND